MKLLLEPLVSKEKVQMPEGNIRQLNPHEITDLPTDIGVYRVFATNADGNPISINRFCGTDESGLLYVGRTTGQTLHKRLYQFYASSNILMKMHNHSGGLKYCLNQIIRDSLGNEHELRFDCWVCMDPKREERGLLAEYTGSTDGFSRDVVSAAVGFLFPSVVRIYPEV